MNIAYLMVCTAALGLAADSASAQTADSRQASALPDPATIKLPDITGTPVLDSEGDAKYFYFHKAGVSFETAVADFAECLSYATRPDRTTRLPGHLVIDETAPTRAPGPDARAVPVVSPYGMAGQLIADLLMPSLMRRAHQGGMRICMGYKNYKRYPLSKEAYLALTEKDPANTVFMQAKLASGPAPTIESVAP